MKTGTVMHIKLSNRTGLILEDSHTLGGNRSFTFQFWDADAAPKVGDRVVFTRDNTFYDIDVAVNVAVLTEKKTA